VLAAEDLTTLASALVAAELADDLNELGPFTLMAPTDEAFDKLPPELLTTLLADPLLLASVLQYHLIVDDVAAADLAAIGTAATAQGEVLTVSIASDATILVNDATVVEADIVASNGRVHKIDTVLLPSTITVTPALVPTATPAAGLPVTSTAIVTDAGVLTDTEVVTGDAPILQPTPVPAAPVTGTEPATSTSPVTVPAVITAAVDPLIDMSTLTILEIINARPDLSTVATALAAAGLAEALVLPGPFTLFAPTNDAFTALPAEVQTSVLNEGTARAALLQRHLIADTTDAAQLATLGSALTTSGETLSITLSEDGTVLVDGVPIIESIQAANGVVHVVSGVVVAPAP
jgi:uncharacterized surface protein with fasciclin (FAS1) repeats